MKITLAFVALALVLVACSSSTPQVAITQVVTQVLVTQIISDDGAPTYTPYPTYTLYPTNIPTDAPSPTPEPTSTPEIVAPVTIPYEGAGDTVLDIDVSQINNGPGALRINGNETSSFFAIIGYTASGERTDTFVNTGDPYVGLRPLNLDPDEITTRLEIKATGFWEIELLSLSTDLIRTLIVPGNIAGTGDEVILLAGATPDIAIITGNEASSFFAVLAHESDGGYDAIVNTGDPYNGSVVMKPNVIVLEIKATGAWTIDIAAK